MIAIHMNAILSIAIMTAHEVPVFCIDAQGSPRRLGRAFLQKLDRSDDEHIVRAAFDRGRSVSWPC
ncbi:MAG: hypothetical protein WDN46_03100 [Methylocella sp.]